MAQKELSGPVQQRPSNELLLVLSFTEWPEDLLVEGTVTPIQPSLSPSLRREQHMPPPPTHPALAQGANGSRGCRTGECRVGAAGECAWATPSALIMSSLSLSTALRAMPLSPFSG